MSARMEPLAQGSPEWLTFRRSHRNASETPALMGCNPWQPKTPVQLARIKRGLDTIQENRAMQRGHELEARIREQLESITGRVFEPAVVVSGEYAASLDAVTFEGDVIIEIKAPGASSPTWNDASAGRVPDHYGWQIQHQLMVSGAKRCVFAVGDGESTPLTLDVLPDPLAHAAIRAAWDKFWPLMEAQESELVEYAARADDAWLDAAAQYQAALVARNGADERLSKAREALLELSDGVPSEGAGLRMIRTIRQGAVDYARIPELRNVDLTPYRKPGTEYWTIKEIKQ